MDDLQARFRRLDRVQAPYLWNEAVGRSVELELAPRRAFNPGLALMAVALLLATMAGTLAVGAWLNDQLSPEPEILTYDNGMIVMQQACDGLVGVDPISAARRQLAAAPDGCELGWWAAPAWSNDGTRLAYIRPGGEQETHELWVYEASTGESRLLSECSDGCVEGGLDISPDGSLVAFSAADDTGVDDLVVVAVDSGEEHRIDLTGQVNTPQFSPDGSRIAVSVLGGQSGVHVVDISGLPEGSIGIPTLIHGIVDAFELTWSPDGRWIAMTQSGGLGGLLDEDRPAMNGQITLSSKAVVIARADGSEARILATLPTQDYGAWPSWSADSESVAFATTPIQDEINHPRLELWTVTIDGGEPQRIYATGCCIDGFTGPAWSPDGEWIAFGISRAVVSAGAAMFLVRPDGSDLHEIADTVLAEPVWQPLPQADAD